MSESVYGIHAVEDLLAVSHRSVEKIWVQQGTRNPRLLALMQEARTRSVPFGVLGRKELDRLVGGARHQGVVAVCVGKASLSLDDLLEIPRRLQEPPFFLALDRVEDPGNLGAVIRTAAAGGVHGLILPKRGSAPLNAVVRKRSAGALERVAVARVTNLVRSLEKLKKSGSWIVGASSDGAADYRDQDLSGPTVLVIGGERGLRRLVREHCDLVVSIPMRPGAESLNLSVAAALMIYEVVRARRGPR